MKNSTKLVPLAICGTLISLACSPSSPVPLPATGGTLSSGGTVSTGGTTLATGGLSVSTGGTVSSGGATSTGGAVSSGGTETATGGAATASGGASAASCMGTSGAITSTYVDNGTICGYAFPAAWGGASTVPAEEFASGSTELCVTGSIPAEVAAAEATGGMPAVEGVYPGLSIGFGVQEIGSTKGTWTVAGTSITIDAVAEGANMTDAGALRVMFRPTEAPADAGASKDVGYAYWLPAGTTFPVTVEFSKFMSLPWSADGSSVVGKTVDQFSLQIGGRTTGAQTITNFCLKSVTVNK
jgi:hypothetical protein